MTETKATMTADEQARQEGYRELFDNSPIGIINVGLDGKPIMVNERAATTFGYSSPEEFLASVPSMLGMWVDLRERDRAAETLLETGVLRDFEVVMQRRDGTRLVVSVSANPLKARDGSVIGLQISGIDITDRVRAEQLLEEAQGQALIAFWSWRLDSNDFAHTRKLCDVLGIDPRVAGDMHIKDLQSFVHPGDRDMVSMKLATIEPVPGRRFEFEFRILTKSSTTKWLVARGCVDDDGKQVSGSIQDITKQKLVQEKLTQLNEMKTEFVGLVAHDLSSPLAVAKGYVDFLRGQWDDIEEAERHSLVGKIQRALLRLDALVAAVSEVTALDSGVLSFEIRVFDLAEVVRSTVDDLSSVDSFPPCTLSIAEELPLAFGSQETVERILTNLISNAVKYAPGSPIAVDVDQAGGVLKVSVRDEGPGIAKSDQAKLFQKFSRLSSGDGRDRPAGTGLGLYICKSLVEASGGAIWVDSAPGAGSTFTFTVRIAAEDLGHLAG